MVELSCGEKCIKYFLFAFNLVFVVAGLCLLILAGAAAAHGEVADMLKLMAGSTFTFALVALAVLGGFMLILGFLGCCGALKENHCMVLTYAILICVILIAQVAFGVAGIVMSPQMRDLIRKGLLPTLKKYEKDSGKPVTNYWDALQTRLECCGARDYKDWAENAGYTGNKDVPDSCCTSASLAVGCGANQRTTPDKIYTKGCIAAMESWVNDNIALVAGIALAIAFIETFGIVCACCLARGIKHGYTGV